MCVHYLEENGIFARIIDSFLVKFSEFLEFDKISKFVGVCNCVIL